jgi:hypothetical protein|tara:strand:+ start:235 stop:1281 length:1047 start_codon:yes stop_codon:yes gene_type:complete
MAKKTVYQQFNTDALKHFELDNDSKYGVIVNHNVEEVLVTQDVTTYEKVHSILYKDTVTDQTLQMYKKAFVLPNSEVSLDRLKAALREHKITVTNDYEQADLIVTHNGFSGRQVQNGEKIPSTVMMSKLWNYETTIEGAPGTPSPINTLIQNYDGPVIIDEKITSRIRYYNLETDESLYDTWMLTGLAINLAHLIDIGEVDVVDVDTVLHSSANRCILDEELLSDIIAQVNSHNNDDVALAGKIIPTIDYTQNLHLFWVLTQECYRITHAYNRDKDIQYWLSQSNFNEISDFNAEAMILYLEEKELLDSKSFRYLEPRVRSEITIHNRDLYVFKVSVKKEYQKYLKNV